jgi:hypothetical protein
MEPSEYTRASSATRPKTKNSLIASTPTYRIEGCAVGSPRMTCPLAERYSTKSMLPYDIATSCLSEHSIRSDWVEDEVTKAFEEERKRDQVVLFPIRIDDTAMQYE